MSDKKITPQELELRRQVAELETRLGEAEETLRAIREGEVDAVIVSGSKGDQVFSLVGTESIYRLVVQTMKEAAFTVTFDGTILFANAQFGELLGGRWNRSSGAISANSWPNRSGRRCRRCWQRPSSSL